MIRRTTRSIAIGLASLAGLVAFGCKSKPSEVAPVQNGSFLKYSVQQSTMGNNPVGFDVALAFTAQGDDKLQIQFQSTRGSEPPITVDRALNPDDRTITAFSLGRLWIPTNTRRQGVVTDCGRVDKQRKFLKWEVWDIQGNCVRSQGARYYDVNTGILVGFQVSIDGKDLSGTLVESR